MTTRFSAFWHFSSRNAKLIWTPGVSSHGPELADSPLVIITENTRSYAHADLDSVQPGELGVEVALRCLGIRLRCGAAPDPLLGCPAQARQQLHRAPPQRAAARPHLSLRDDSRRADVRAARELRPRADRGPEAGGQGLPARRRAPQDGPPQSPRDPQAAHRDHRPAGGARPRDRGLEARLRNRHGPGPRPPGLLHPLLHGAHARPDAQARRRGRGAVHRGGRPQAPRVGQSRHHGQLPGGLGLGPALRRPPRHRGAAHPQRGPHVLLGRRVGRQPHALQGGHAGRRLAHLDALRPGQRQVRRGPPRLELRVPQPGQHVLVEELQGLLRDRHGGGAVPQLREVVGRVLHHERRGDPLHREQPLRGQQARAGQARAPRGRAPEPQEHPEPHRGLCLQGRQHHAAAAGPRLDPPRVPFHRRDQGARPGHRLHHPRGHRPPGHLRRGQRGEKGAQGDHPQLRDDRLPAVGPLRDGDRGRRDEGRLHDAFRGEDPGGHHGARRPPGGGGGLRCRGAGLRVQRPGVPQLPEPLGEGMDHRAFGGDDALAPPPEAAALLGLRHEPAASPSRSGGSAGPGAPKGRARGKSVQRLREGPVGLHRRLVQLLPRLPRPGPGIPVPGGVRPRGAPLLLDCGGHDQGHDRGERARDVLEGLRNVAPAEVARGRGQGRARRGFRAGHDRHGPGRTRHRAQALRGGRRDREDAQGPAEDSPCRLPPHGKGAVLHPGGRRGAGACRALRADPRRERPGRGPGPGPPHRAGRRLVPGGGKGHARQDRPRSRDRSRRAGE